MVSLYNFDLSNRLNYPLYAIAATIPLTVDVFFVITGFLTTGSLLNERAVSLRKFMLSRLVRILPLYLMIVLLVAVLNAFVPTFSVRVKTMVPVETDTYVLDKIVDGGSGYVVLKRDGSPLLIEPDIGGNKERIRITSSNSSAKVITSKHGLALRLQDMRPGQRFEDSEIGPNIRTFDKQSKKPDRAIWPYLLFLQNYIHTNVQLEHTWFLALIVQFYILYCILIYLLRRFVGSPDIMKPVLFVILVGAIVLVNVLRWKLGPSIFRDDGLPYYQMTHLRIDAILIGCVLKLAEPYLLKLLDTESAAKYLLPAASLIGGVVIMGYVYINIPYSWDMVPFIFTIHYLAIAMLIVATYRSTLPSRLLLENSTIRWIGTYSLGIYLFHYPFMYYFVITRNFVHTSNAVSIFTFVLLSILAGAAIEGVSRMLPFIKSITGQLQAK